MLSPTYLYKTTCNTPQTTQILRPTQSQRSSIKNFKNRKLLHPSVSTDYVIGNKWDVDCPNMHEIGIVDLSNGFQILKPNKLHIMWSSSVYDVVFEVDCDVEWEVGAICTWGLMGTTSLCAVLFDDIVGILKGLAHEWSWMTFVTEGWQRWSKRGEPLNHIVTCWRGMMTFM